MYDSACVLCHNLKFVLNRTTVPIDLWIVTSVIIFRKEARIFFTSYYHELFSLAIYVLSSTIICRHRFIFCHGHLPII